MQQIQGSRRAAADGFTLVELMLSMGITLLVMGVTMSVLSDALRANQAAIQVTDMNRTLRTAMDLMTRDLLQVGQGLPPGRVITVPSGNGSATMRLPGPPLTAFTMRAGETSIAAVQPGAGLGPIVNGVRTDVITFLASDGAFDTVTLTNLQNDRMTVALPAVSVRGLDISNGGPDDLEPGQLIMLVKGGTTAFVEVTSVDGLQTAFFAANDSLRLNQNGAAAGNVAGLRAQAPPDAIPPQPAEQVIPTTATRVRMITYYVDSTTTPGRPRLVRRMNNGDPMTFDNKLGSTVAFDITNLQVSYDLTDGATNLTNVRMDARDLDITGRCAPDPCAPNQIRKVNLALTGTARRKPGDVFYNTLTSQVSLRSMAFVDRYR
jgi:type II secretory pathway pseudopilin PulG